MKHKYSLSDHPEARQRAIWLIRDYPKIKERYNLIDGLPGGSGGDGGPRSTVPHSITQDAAVERAELTAYLKPVEWALEQIPAEYRRGIWDNIVSRTRFPDDADINTWKKWKQKYIYLVALAAGYIWE